MKKNKSLFLIFLLLLIPQISFCSEVEDEIHEENKSLIEEQFDKLNLSGIENFLDNLDKTTYDYFPKISLKEFILSMIKGENRIDGKSILIGILKIFLKEVLANITILINILSIVIISGILTNLQSSFETNNVSKLAYFVSYMVISIILIRSFSISLSIGKEAVDNMVNFMEIMLPPMLGLLIAVGGTTTSVMFNPLIIGTVNIVGTVIRGIIFPLIFFSFIIGLLSKISDKIQFGRLAELIRGAAVTIIGIALTVFIGVISMYGVASKVDGVTIRTAKFAVDKFIPIIGKFLSDAVETVVGCSAILKNAVGVIGLFALFLICIIPVMKIISIIFLYKLTIAIIEPISGQKEIECLNEVSKSLTLILASILSVATMFFITITIIIEAGNATLMLR
ncbi:MULTISPECIES: stage III sporulation protein AE [Tissierellales]|uniref:Stage III sporulation protein AE n=1 Tax=Acidilutibacter cellobiosedens TaxID=2507161 RepID=A0A410QCQ6_9FIRM|nr:MULTISPECIES: stage III sporulation protein AE [Tissierellales]MBE6082589.1 stage III sporulation protein AE [Tissierellaceae bacterium]QAT61771.1 stage III sporulation protein AE [Acidilutibacter cellobiosedens]SCL82322.1 Stage III sporulation protein AE precursor [Sporanaerobacter sp. PP17-6a]